jgi:hypothetical protein
MLPSEMSTAGFGVWRKNLNPNKTKPVTDDTESSE